jgi:hypothetical protein
VIQIHSGFLVISARYLKLKNGVWWYQRRNPKELRDKFGLPIHIRKSLGTKNPSEAAGRARSLNASIEANWEKLRVDRGDPVATTQLTRTNEPAEALPRRCEEERLLDLLTPNRPRQALSAATPVIAARHDALAAPFLSEAVDLYLSQHPSGDEKRFAGNTRLAIGKVREAVGDLRLDEYTRQHANKVRDHMLDSLKTASVRRRLDSISAVFRAVVDEHGLKQADGIRSIENPFSGVRILALRRDSQKREEFTHEELKALAAACRQFGDDRRLIIAILLDTGARLGEIVGLRISDVCLSRLLKNSSPECR